MADGRVFYCHNTEDAVIIDPVDAHWERDLQQLQRLDLRLAFVLETHAHADHVTSAGKLRQVTGAGAAVPSGCGIASADVQLEDGDVIRFTQIGAGQPTFAAGTGLTRRSMLLRSTGLALTVYGAGRMLTPEAFEAVPESPATGAG